MHMAHPGDVLQRMAAALRPGGWLIAEEPDNGVAASVDPTHPLAEVFDTCYRKRIEFVAAAEMMDLCFGKILPACMQTLGLVEMGNEGIARVFCGGEPLSRMWIQTWQRIDEVLIANDVLTDSEVADSRR